MAQRDRGQVPFGSDSFLDIVANIVGILIILIVVTGVRMRNAPIPVKLAEATETETKSPPLLDTNPVDVKLQPVTEQREADADLPIEVTLTDDPIPLEEPIRIAEQTSTEALPLSLLLEDAVPEETARVDVPNAPAEPMPVLLTREQIEAMFPPLPEVAAPAESVSAADEMKDHISSLAEEAQVLALEIERKERDVQAAEAQAERLRQHLTEMQADSNHARQQLAELQAVSESVSAEIGLLRDKLEQTRQAPPPVSRLQHDMAPIGRIVTGREVHFRLAGNRVSHVPIDRLAEEAQRQTARHRDDIFRQNFYRGTVGPREGFLLHVLIERKPASLLEEARLGHGQGRIAASWIIEPTPQLIAETFEEAIAVNSRFRQSILSQGTSASVTFWVYPDSYEIHRRLKALVHDSGFWVASRPLPHDLPISGTDNGSHSVAQ